MLLFLCLLGTLFFPGTLLPQPLVISLGSDCQVTAEIREAKLREAAFPFDWVVTEDFESVIQALEDDFKHWLDPAYLEYKNNQILNTYYGISFVHDFPIIGSPHMSDEADHTGFGLIDPNFLNYLSPAAEKFKRRFDRLSAALNSNHPIIFIRANASPSSARHFVSMMKQKYPTLPFTLVVVSPSKLLNFDWNIEGVRNFYALDPSGSYSWWWGPKTWQMVFKELSLFLGVPR